MIPPKNDHFGPTNPFRPRMGLDPPYLADRALMMSANVRRLAAYKP
jgi:hypothetical protein